MVVGGPLPGWHAFEDGYKASADFKPDAETSAADPMQLYFTSGTTSKPKLVMHTQVTYPVGHLSTMYWIGLRPGDIHCNISSPGWAKHAWSCFFAPWNAEATVFVPNQLRFNAKGLLEALTRANVTTLCAPPTVWRMLVTQQLADYKTKLREVVSAGEPLNPEIIDQVRATWGLTIREGYGQTETTAVAGNSPGQPVKPASLGRPMPGFRLLLQKVDDPATEEGELCLELDPRPIGLMIGYQKPLAASVPRCICRPVMSTHSSCCAPSAPAGTLAQQVRGLRPRRDLDRAYAARSTTTLMSGFGRAPRSSDEGNASGDHASLAIGSAAASAAAACSQWRLPALTVPNRTWLWSTMLRFRVVASMSRFAVTIHDAGEAHDPSGTNLLAADRPTAPSPVHSTTTSTSTSMPRLPA